MEQTEQINEMVKELKEKEEQKKEKETMIKVKIERGFSPILQITHEDYTIKWGIPFLSLIHI